MVLCGTEWLEIGRILEGGGLGCLCFAWHTGVCGSFLGRWRGLRGRSGFEGMSMSVRGLGWHVRDKKKCACSLYRWLEVMKNIVLSRPSLVISIGIKFNTAD